MKGSENKAGRSPKAQGHAVSVVETLIGLESIANGRQELADLEQRFRDRPTMSADEVRTIVAPALAILDQRLTVLEFKLSQVVELTLPMMCQSIVGGIVKQMGLVPDKPAN